MRTGWCTITVKAGQPSHRLRQVKLEGRQHTRTDWFSQIALDFVLISKLKTTPWRAQFIGKQGLQHPNYASRSNSLWSATLGRQSHKQLGRMCDPGLQGQQQKRPKFSGALQTEKEVLLLLFVLDISQARSRNKTKTKVLFPWQDSAPQHPRLDSIKISINSSRVDKTLWPKHLKSSSRRCHKNQPN